MQLYIKMIWVHIQNWEPQCLLILSQLTWFCISWNTTMRQSQLIVISNISNTASHHMSHFFSPGIQNMGSCLNQKWSLFLKAQHTESVVGGGQSQPFPINPLYTGKKTILENLDFVLWKCAKICPSSRNSQKSSISQVSLRKSSGVRHPAVLQFPLI